MHPRIVWTCEEERVPPSSPTCVARRRIEEGGSTSCGLWIRSVALWFHALPSLHAWRAVSPRSTAIRRPMCTLPIAIAPFPAIREETPPSLPPPPPPTKKKKKSVETPRSVLFFRLFPLVVWDRRWCASIVARCKLVRTSTQHTCKRSPRAACPLVTVPS